MNSKQFWDKVDKCNHKFNPNYYEHISCAHTYLGCSGGSEEHCLLCGVYVIEDRCGDQSGMSGWSSKRWTNIRKKERDLECWNNRRWYDQNGKRYLL